LQRARKLAQNLLDLSTMLSSKASRLDGLSSLQAQASGDAERALAEMSVEAAAMVTVEARAMAAAMAAANAMAMAWQQPAIDGLREFVSSMRRRG
jgi:hypothetical protein